MGSRQFFQPFTFNKLEKQKSRKAQIIKNASKGNDKFEKDPFAIEKVARFVSMIPYLADVQMFKNMELSDMYTNCQEFLDIGGGDYEEHAILLANFF